MEQQDLQAKADSIRERIKNLQNEIIEIGRELCAIKEMLPHGAFTPWVNDTLRISMRTVQNYMKVAKFVEKLPRDESEKLALLPPSSLIQLASEGCSDNARKKVLAKLSGGKAIKGKVVTETIKQSKPPKVPTTTTEPNEKRHAAERLFASICDWLAGVDDERLQGHRVVIKIDGFEFPLDLPSTKAGSEATMAVH